MSSKEISKNEKGKNRQEELNEKGIQ